MPSREQGRPKTPKKEYAQSLKRRKTLTRKEKELKRCIGVQEVIVSTTGCRKQHEYLVSLKNLALQVRALVELLDLDTWKARLACRAKGVSLPPAKRAEQEVYDRFAKLTKEQLQELEQRLEKESLFDPQNLDEEGEWYVKQLIS